MYEEYYKAKLKLKDIQDEYDKLLDSPYLDKLQTLQNGYKMILEERKQILDSLKKELYESKDTYDKIYRLRWIEHLSVNKIKNEVHYEKAQTYRKIREINKKLKMIQNDTR